MPNINSGDTIGAPIFIDFLLDETGSMAPYATSTRTAFDTFIKSQSSENGRCFVTLTKFSTGQIKTPYENLDVARVPELSFFPTGGTNLYDCIGNRLTALMGLGNDSKALFVILTDGEDNSSRSFSAASVSELVTRAQQRGITVVYMGPRPSATATGQRLGIPEGNILPFDISGIEETLSDLGHATHAFRASAETTTASFFN